MLHESFVKIVDLSKKWSSQITFMRSSVSLHVSFEMNRFNLFSLLLCLRESLYKQEKEESLNRSTE